ncbi:MAG: cation diffusion facilitator family transporter [Rhodospirillales bacterium]|nr:cation diffusion facilitator family transporter [Alphaproteobacteria bacterium]MCB9986392.1 cation diffusion facilitator family transporter [Rhodospirillales bacterium]USO07060.1 MAG: cation diffusion facilitator family transporter [Rhodospirillales bacterium]
MTSVKSQRLARNAAIAAVAVSVLLVVAKAGAWLVGGSAALLASLVDSMIDALMSFTNMLALRYAHRPADTDHRYGHGKIEGVAALTQAAFILGACAFVILEAIRMFDQPRAVGAIDLGVAVLVAGTLLTVALTRYQAYAVKKSHSLAVEADAAHYTGDIVANLGVIASLLAGRWLGWLWLDPLVALVVAGWLLYTARDIGLRAIDMLLDRELADDTRTRMFDVIRATPGVEGLHDLRTRRSGARIMVAVDIEVDPGLSMLAAHEIAHAVENNLLASWPDAEVMIHVDPKGGDITDSRHRKLEGFHAR